MLGFGMIVTLAVSSVHEMLGLAADTISVVPTQSASFHIERTGREGGGARAWVGLVIDLLRGIQKEEA